MHASLQPLAENRCALLQRFPRKARIYNEPGYAMQILLLDSKIVELALIPKDLARVTISTASQCHYVQ